MFLFSHCISHLMYVLYWNTRFNKYQIFRNRYRDFFSDTKFSETDTETFFPIPNFPKPIPIPSKNCQKFRNREVSKPKCQSLVGGQCTMRSRFLGELNCLRKR